MINRKFRQFRSVFAGIVIALWLILMPAVFAYKLGFTSEIARLLAAAPGFVICWFLIFPWLEKKSKK